MESTARPIAIQILLFAGARSAIGRDRVDLEVPSGVTLASLRGELARRFPALAGLVYRSRFAVQSEFLTDESILDRPVEVAWIPPVSGG